MSGFKKMRRRDRELTEEQARETLARADHGVLATLGPDGWPYAVPVNHVLLDGLLYIHCAQQGHKLENIAGEERVSYCAVASATVVPAELTTRYESAIVFGRAALVTDATEKQRALEALAVRFCGGLTTEAQKEIATLGARTAILRIRVEHISGKSNRES
jgi:nitroimidazol reductase NimA-like FMN-containing flavoprotein (pyridoxamine 5'-phosphate oxidase superfamily)